MFESIIFVSKPYRSEDLYVIILNKNWIYPLRYPKGDFTPPINIVLSYLLVPFSFNILSKKIKFWFWGLKDVEFVVGLIILVCGLFLKAKPLSD